MRCVIPFYGGDIRQAITLLEWIRDLGGCKRHDCLLVADAETPWMECRRAHQLARESFSKVISITNGKAVGGWIAGSCSLFKAAAMFSSGHIWLWLEPDAVPVEAGWLDKIEEGYENCDKLYMGAVVKHQQPNWPNPYLEGVAVYPVDAWDRMAETWTLAHSWTRSCAGEVVPNAYSTRLIQHIWGQLNKPPTFAEVGIEGTNVFGLDKLRPGAVIFHRVKDGSLIKLLRARLHVQSYPSTPIRPTFGHGGDYGDLIYGLCAIKASGGGHLALVRHAVREVFNPTRVAKIMPLLKAQDYLDSVTYHETDITPHGSEQKPAFVDYNLNLFRKLQFDLRGQGKWENIAESHLRLLGLSLDTANNGPWLNVDEPLVIEGRPVVFARSQRYNNHRFPWNLIVQKYREQAVFIGHLFEHRHFTRIYGAVQYQPVSDLLEMARIIAGARLFVGNQSAPYAIAEGLKQNAILECSIHVPDCVFSRKNLIVGRNARFELPDLV